MTHQQTWWDDNLPKRMNEFTSWIGDSTAISKVYLREYIRQMGYKSVIDLGCGLATEYFTYKKELPQVAYLGVDSSKVLYDKNISDGVPMVLSSAESTSLLSNHSECVFSRHVLEHQPKFEPILEEMVRLASKEAIHIFFIPPHSKMSVIDFNKKENLYHNQFDDREIDKFLLSLPKVVGTKWEPLKSGEKVLHIKLF